jgi:hypothetical protein
MSVDRWAEHHMAVGRVGLWGSCLVVVVNTAADLVDTADWADWADSVVDMVEQAVGMVGLDADTVDSPVGMVGLAVSVGTLDFDMLDSPVDMVDSFVVGEIGFGLPVVVGFLDMAGLELVFGQAEVVNVVVGLLVPEKAEVDKVLVDIVGVWVGGLKTVQGFGEGADGGDSQSLVQVLMPLDLVRVVGKDCLGILVGFVVRRISNLAAQDNLEK